MESILHIPYTIRVLASLFTILIINKLLKNLWFSVIMGTILLSFWTGHSFKAILSISWTRFSSTNNLFLMIIIFQVIWLSTQMSSSGAMKELVNNIRSKVSQRTSIALLPAVIGLLPMPGGAIFSAPLIDDCDIDKNIEPLLKTKINYWFRHIWEYWWPLYPGVLLAVDITGLPILTFMMLQFPLSVLSVIAGYIFLLRKLKPIENCNYAKNKVSFKKFIAPLLPIIIIISCYAIIQIFFSTISKINKYLPMIIGIFIAQIFLQIQRPLSFNTWKKILFSKKTLILTIIVALVRIYGAFIEAQLPDGSLLMTQVRSELYSCRFPLVVIIMLIPFICGLTSGIAIGFVGASFPIVMSLIGENPSLRELLSTTVLAYASGYMGIILSPVHVCLIVSNEYFKTSLTDSLIKLIKPSIIVIAGALILYFIIR